MEINEFINKLKEIIKEEMKECMRLEVKAKENVKFENARLQSKAWAELEWVLGEIDKLNVKANSYEEGGEDGI